MGSFLGQFHPDLPDKDGKIIKAVFIRPKCYYLEYIIPSGEIKKVIKSKGIPLEKVKKLTYEDYLKMLDGQLINISADLIKSFPKDSNEPALIKYEAKKKLNNTPWNGRIYNKELNIWEPIKTIEELRELKII